MMKTKLFKKRVPMLFSAMLTFFALFATFLQAAVPTPMLLSDNNTQQWGSYYYGDYTKGELERAYEYVKITANKTDWSGSYLLVNTSNQKAAMLTNNVPVYNNNISATSVNIQNNTISTLGDAVVCTLQPASTVSGVTYYYLLINNYYIASGYRSSAGTYYFRQSQNTTDYDSGNYQWEVEYTSNSLSITNRQYSTCKIRFDNTNTRFVLATSSSNLSIDLYEQQQASSTYTVTCATGLTGGSITASPNSEVESGATVTVTATPNDCYEVTSVTTTPSTTVTDNGNGTYTFTMPASDVTVNATFAVKSFNVNLSACSNGDLYITGGNVTNHLVSDALYVCEVACNSSVTLEIKNITAGSEFLGWRVNGAIVSTANPWTFTATETVSPTPVFGQKYTVTCAAATNGSISADKATAAETETVTITATPATGYELETLTYTPDGGSAVTISGTTFQMPAANVTVNATFTKACDHYYYLVEEDLHDWTGEYLIVNTTDSKAFNGGLTGVTGSAANVGLDVAENNISVSISSKMITRDATTSAASFNIAKYGDYYTIQSASGYFIGKGSTTYSAGMRQATTRVDKDFDHVITYSNGNVDIVSWQGNEDGGYIRYNKASGQKRFRYYPKSNSQEPIQLYRKGVMKPVITPVDGSVFISGMQPVTITAPDGVSTIYYTTDGTEPTTSSSVYTESFTIYTTTTVKAIAVNECGEASFVATALIRSADDDIVMTPVSGTYLAGTEVTIMSPGAFHYTTDGTEPSTTNGTAVSGNSATISVDSTMTIWAVLDSDATKNAKEYYVVPSGTYTGENPDGIVMNKSVSGDFTQSPYTGNITLESYVTGNVTVVEGDPEPVDVVLVLDFSNSMQGVADGDTLDDGTEKIVALKNAVDGFLIQLKASSDVHPDTPNRVAFVLYGSKANGVYGQTYGSSMFYLNSTELNAVTEAGDSDYSDSKYNSTNCNAAFFSFGDDTYTPSWAWETIKGTSTAGGTPTAHGVHAAERIFNYDTDTDRKRILVTFTDGAPGLYSWVASSCDVSPDSDGVGAAVANQCLELAHTMKNASSPVTSFSVGIFKGASSDEASLPTYYTGGTVEGADEYAQNANRFMSLLSSNADEQSLCGESSWSNKGYYLTASTSDGLANAFAGIAHAAGGASADLTSNTIVQDVMTGQFRIPEGTTVGQITVQTAECTGYTAPDTTWAAPEALANPGIQISEDGKTIIVTGFNYSSNWVGYDADGDNWHGKKLIITIPITLEATSDDDVFHGTFATNAAGSGIYDADGMPVGNFTSPTTNVDHGKVTWVQKVTAQPSTWTVTNDTVMIGTENDLAWFISYVNGMNGATAQPAAKAKLTADLDMSANLWVPIGYNSSHKFTGTFDGNGYTIKGINIPTESAAEYISWRFNTGTGINGSTTGETTTGTVTSYAMGTPLQYEGFFGYAAENAKINNLFLTGGKFVTDTIANVMIGGVTGASYGSTEISFAESAVELVLSEKATNATIGGIVGHCANNDNCKINAVMAVGDITINGSAKSAGSVSGNLGAVKTFYTNHTISGEGTVTTKNKNFKNGYVRISNEGYDITSANGYTPSQFTAPTAYTYGSYSTNNTVNGTPLVDVLNDESNLASGYKWMRSTSQAINGDYPIIVKAENDGFAIVNDSEDGKIVRYQEINTLLGMEKYQDANHSVFMYNNDELTTAPSGTKLYIDQNVAMTQSAACGAVNAYVSVTMDNSNGAAEMHRDWHGFAASIKAGKIGISYGNHQVTNPGYSENDLTFGNGADDDYYLIQGDNAVYFPDGIVNATNPGKQFDIYSFFEDQYHWINLKRAPGNHWHQDGEHAQITNYTNEKSFTPGKGYFVALGDNTDNNNNLMQAYGTLNNGATAITVPITNSGAHLKGYNLLGNPFQSYLDFNAFAETNKNIWAGTSSMGYKSYMIYDADKGGFREYLTDGSQSFSQNAAQDAPRYINMHQAFFVVKDGSASDVTFNNDMRVTDATVADGTSFRDVRPAYPLVNLFCTDEDGKQEISVVELNRPEMAGSLKMKGMLNGKCNMYLHWGNEDFGSMFIDHTPDYVPVWFDAAEDGVFTISWNTQNAAFGYVHFVDNMTGADIDCLEADSYTFEARTTDMSARFRLVFSPLGVEDITTENGENFAFFNGSELVVNGEGELSLIDLNGRVLTTTFVSGQQSNVMLPTVAEGMYLLRLTKANGVKVQKIVIRK